MLPLVSPVSPTCVAICLLAVFHPGISLQAAPVTFSNPVTVRDEHDVLTSGALDRAIGFGGSDQTVNGVTFNAGKADGGQQTVDYGATILTASPDSIVALGDSPTFGGDGEPANSLPKPYRDLLAAGAYNNTTKGTLTVTLAGLAAGTSYTAQFFINDSRDFHGGGRSATVSSEGATSQALRFSNTGAAGGVGQYVTATFTADHTTQDFVIAPLRPGIDDAQINCLQLRSNAPGSSKSAARPQANPVRPKLD